MDDVSFRHFRGTIYWIESPQLRQKSVLGSPSTKYKDSGSPLFPDKDTRPLLNCSGHSRLQAIGSGHAGRVCQVQYVSRALVLRVFRQRGL
jgi:hypothetical protein